MKTKTIIVSTIAVTAVAVTAQSCLAVATTGIGLAIIKKILTGGITKSLGIFKNKNAFLENNLIDQALPSQLKNLNTVLEKVAPNLVAKERDYIAQAAAYTVNLSEPILLNAVNDLTEDDVTRIAKGGSGTATMVLKEKTASQLTAAIMPKVDEKLNQFGITKSINTALAGSNMLGSLLGGQSSSSVDTSGNFLSKMASEQLVNGLFNIIEDYEKQNSAQLYQSLGKK